MLNCIKASANTIDETVDLLIQEFNKQKRSVKSLQFLNMHLTQVLNADDILTTFGVIITEHDEQIKPRFIGMPIEADPTNPDWNRTYIGS